MQKVIHRAGDRGRGEHGWLSTRYSFSFANWYEPSRMGFGALRVLNDDTIAPASGFPTHAHKDMEIITIVTEGAVTHKDSLQNEKKISKGEVQVMSAGTGVAHSEYNASIDAPLALFQLWITPKENGIAPQYAQRDFALAKKQHGLTLLAAPRGEGEDGALLINQDAYLSYGVLDAAHPIEYTIRKKGNGVYLFVVEGVVTTLEETLETRDAFGVTSVDLMSVATSSSARVLFIEVPMKE